MPRIIKTYHENIWKDDMYLIQLEEIKGDKRKEIAAITLKLENKEFKSKNEGEKAKFVAERKLAQIDQEIKTVSEKVKPYLAGTDSPCRRIFSKKVI